MPIRFAIWSAVSTEAQAGDDKASLEEQVRRARATGSAKGWTECGSYIVPGESRTRWVSLRDAEEHIPQLKQMLDAAQAGQFDVVVCYDYTRFRDLLDQVAKTLSAYHVQLYSISQPSEVITPAEYSPYSEDSSAILRSVFQAMSRSEISTMRRRHALGMPKRVLELGLHAGHIPFGYRKPPGREDSPRAVLIPDPLTAATAVRIKDLFLAGESLNSIGTKLWQEGAPRPYLERHHVGKWSLHVIKTILTNPFYCGIVRYGMSRLVNDPRTGKRKQIPNAEYTTAKGAHEPLWDMQTYQQILAEAERRGLGNYRGPNKTHIFSNLLYCGACGAKLTYDHANPKARWAYDYYRCRARNIGNTPHRQSWSEQELKQLIADELKKHPPTEALPESDSGGGEFGYLQAAMQELENRMARIEVAYEAAEYTLEKYSVKASEIRRQMEVKSAEIAEYQRKHTDRVLFNNTLEALRGYWDEMGEWFDRDDPLTVNRLLSDLLQKVIVHQDKRIELIWR